jgi:hypothetical protein
MLMPTFKDLDSLTDQDLRDRYDEANKVGQWVQLGFYLDELRRRESKRSETRMLCLTWVIAALTCVNVAAVVAAIFV